MKRGKWFLGLAMIVVYAVFALSGAGGISAEAETSELVEFKSKMMQSVSSQIHSASDLTTTEGNRAALAALLSLEFANQRSDFTIDYLLPIYVCKQGDIAAVALGGDDDYVLIIYQSDPLATCYGILKGNNPGTIRATLEATNESVWKVSLDDYNEKLLALIAQIG